MRNVFWLLVFYACINATAGFCESKTSPMGFPYEQRWELDSSTVHFKFTGESQRKLLFLRLYDVAHYIDADARVTTSEQILRQDINRQLSIRYQHSISASRLRSVLLDGFHLNSTPSEWEQIEDKVEKLIAKINRDASSGDEMIIRWLANNRVMFYLNGALIAQTQHRIFAKVLWSIWLGPHSVVRLQELLSSLGRVESHENGK